jgi:hypothetical protein
MHFNEQLKNAIKVLENPSFITENDTLLLISCILLHSFTYRTMIYEHLNETLKLDEKDDSGIIFHSPYDDQIYAESIYYHFNEFKNIEMYFFSTANTSNAIWMLCSSLMASFVAATFTRIRTKLVDEKETDYKPNFDDLQTICITKLEDEELDRLFE